MLRQLILNSLFLFLTLSCFAQNNFQAYFSIPGAGTIVEESAINRLPDGGFIIAASFSVSSTNCHQLLIRLNSNGDTLWTKDYSDGSTVSLPTVIPISTGGFLFAFKHEPSNGLMVVRTDDNGNKIWSTLNNIQGEINHPYAIENNDGSFIIAGLSGPDFASGISTPFLLKMDTSGNILWRRRYLPSGSSPSPAFVNNIQLGLTKTLDNGYAIATHAVGGGFGGMNGFVIKTDSAGTVVWTSISGTNNNEAYRSITSTRDSGLIAVGYELGPLSSDEYRTLVTKFDNNGTILWAKSYGNNIRFLPFDVEELDDGSIFIGANEQPNGSSSGAFFKIDATGDLLWANKFNRYGFWGSAAISQDGGFVGVGLGLDSITLNDRLVIIKADSLGNFACQNTPLTLTTTNLNLQNSSSSSLGFTVVTPINDSTIVSQTAPGLVYYCDPPLSTPQILEPSTFDLHIFPNPTDNFLTIDIEKSNQDSYNLRIVNLQGRTIFEQLSINNSSQRIDCSNWSQGVYLLVCSQKGSRIQTRKFLVQKSN